MNDTQKITIIEGPPPVFELAGDPLLHSLLEGPAPAQVAMCQVRTINGPALVERCYRAWKKHASIHLEYRNDEGLTRQAPILAARWSELSEGHILSLWVKLKQEEFNIEIHYGLDDDQDFLDDEDFLNDDPGIDLI